MTRRVLAYSPLTALLLAGLCALIGTAVIPVARAGKVAEHDFVGAERCRSCHQEAYEVWRRGPHAGALRALAETEQRDGRCVQCHSMLPDDTSDRFAGVQCETCHGPGRYYAPAHVMRDEELRDRLMFQVPTEKTCLRCHTDNTPSLQPFSYEAMKERIRHWPVAEQPASSGG